MGVLYYDYSMVLYVLHLCFIFFLQINLFEIECCGYSTWLAFERIFQFTARGIFRSLDWLKCWYTNDFIARQMLCEVKDI